jgi:ferritin
MAFEDSYAHEQKVTGLIHRLVDLARAENDHAAEVFLAWFVTEQVEEEANASQIVEKLKMIKDQPQGLLMLDAQLAGRE